MKKRPFHDHVLAYKYTPDELFAKSFGTKVRSQVKYAEFFVQTIKVVMLKSELGVEGGEEKFLNRITCIIFISDFQSFQ